MESEEQRPGPKGLFLLACHVFKGLKAPAPSDLPCFQRPEGPCSLRKHDRSLAELRLLCAAGRKYSAKCGEEIRVGDAERDQRDREIRTLRLRWRVLTEEQRRRD